VKQIPPPVSLQSPLSHTTSRVIFSCLAYVGPFCCLTIRDSDECLFRVRFDELRTWYGYLKTERTPGLSTTVLSLSKSIHANSYGGFYQIFVAFPSSIYLAVIGRVTFSIHHITIISTNLQTVILQHHRSAHLLGLRALILALHHIEGLGRAIGLITLGALSVT
jgi:hypothetical protein